MDLYPILYFSCLGLILEDAEQFSAINLNENRRREPFQ